MAVDKRNVQTSTGKANQALNENELENYGVWVKSEPRTISTFTDEGSKTGYDTDSIGLEDVGDEEGDKDETFLTLEEETLLDSFGDETPPSSSSPSSKADFSVDDIKKPLKSGKNVEEIEEPLEISLDAFESEDFPKPETLEAGQDIESIDLHEPSEIGSVSEEFQEEFAIPDFNISESESEESAISDEPKAEVDSFDALLEAEEIDLGDIPAIEEEAELEAEPIEEKKGFAEAASNEEEISLEDFGIENEVPSRKSAKKASSSDESEEVSLEDFVDIETFGISSADHPSKEGDEELEPIEMNLDFDDSIETEPLSLVRERESSAPSFEDTLQEEPAPAYSGPKIDTEAVTDFDDFLKSDSTPQIVRQPGKRDQGATSPSLDVTGDFIDSGLIEDSALEDQTGLLSEAESVDLSAGSFESDKGAFEASAEDTLANIDNLTDDISLDAISAATNEDLPDFEFANEEEELSSGNAEVKDLGDFDEIQALERSLTEGEEEVRGKEESVSASQTSILHKIANELSTIKEELASLKDELSSMRSGAKEALPSEDGIEKKAKGFFDEEEDETIALTGDELDNILNTADFTEETGAPETHEGELVAASELVAAGEFGADEELEDLIPLESAEKAPKTKVSLGEERKPSLPGARDDQGLSELNRIHDQGIAAMTAAPEDTSYLEEPIDEELESLTLPETPLEEPDLSDFIVSDETDLGGGNTEEAEEELLEDITLDLDSDLGSDTLADNVSELVSGADETDDFLSEISLAEESLPETDDMEELPGISFAEEPTIPIKAKIEKTKPAFSEQAPAKKAPESDLPKATTPRATMPQSSQPTATLPAATLPKDLSPNLKNDIKSVLQYMDRLLESLPEEKIEEFAHSEHFSVYKKLFEELGLL